jgi:hypothetical protein
MDIDIIKTHLSFVIGGKPSNWKRTEKFKFSSSQDFSEKELNNMDPADLAHADFNNGVFQTSGVCRVFIAELDMGDTTAHVITSGDDKTIVYISASSD